MCRLLFLVYIKDIFANYLKWIRFVTQKNNDKYYIIHCITHGKIYNKKKIMLQLYIVEYLSIHSKFYSKVLQVNKAKDDA